MRLQRPFVVAGVIATWVFMHTTAGHTEAALLAVNNAAAIVGFYLFGDRTLF